MFKLPGILKRDFIRNMTSKCYYNILGGLQGRLHSAIPREKEGLRAAIKDLKAHESSYLGDIREVLSKGLNTLLTELDK